MSITKNHKSVILTYGGGVNSVSLLIYLINNNIPIDYILFSDTKGEKPKTYEHIKYMNEWLKDKFYTTPDGIKKKYPKITCLEPYKPGGLYNECIEAERLPGLAYGFKSCSEKWKIRPFMKFCRKNNVFPAVVFKGIDAGEGYRISDYSDKNQTVLFPLYAIGFDRIDCVKYIIDNGVKVPPKSSCFFCPAMRPNEIRELKKETPELFEQAVKMEKNANLTKIRGLGRSFNWEQLVKQQIIDFDTSVKPCQRCHE